jgi:hypothetical protein
MPGAGPFDNQRKAWAEHYPFHPEAPTDGNLTPPSEPAIRSSLDVFGIVFFGRLGHQLNLRKIGVVKLLV